MKRTSLVVLMLFAICGADAAEAGRRRLAPQPVVGDPQTARANFERLGLPVPNALSALVAEGERLFFEETFGGNGRTCGTCHPVLNNLTIDPDFVATLPADDPLFLAEFDPDLALLERPVALRGLTLIVEDTVDQFLGGRRPNRSVPHIFSLALTIGSNRVDPPLDNTGWSADGSPGDGTLLSFANGAVIQHFPRTLNRVEGVDFRLPTQEELDAMFAFLISVGPTEFPDLESLQFTDEATEEGRQLFLGDAKCNLCHENAGATITIPGLEDNLINTGVEDSENAAQGLPRDGGFGVAPDGLGGLGDGRFAPPPLLFAADTPPFFHNSSESTLKKAVEFYDSNAFKDSPAAALLISLDPNGMLLNDEADPLVDLLTVLNALENLRSAGRYQERSFTHRTPSLLLDIASSELEDAIQVLEIRLLHPEAVLLIESARSLTQQAQTTGDLTLLVQAMTEQQLARELMVSSP